MAGPFQSPFKLAIFDKHLTRTGWIGDPLKVSVTPRHMAIGTLSLTVPVSHPKLPMLTERGSRLTCEYRGEQIFSGPRRPLVGQGPLSSGTVTITYEDDIRLLWRFLGYPSPERAADDQPDAEDRRSGPAETVLKKFVQVNAAARDWRPVFVGVDQGRGALIDVGIRMVPLADKLIDVVEQAGLGISVRQGRTGLVLDVYEPSLYPRRLSEASGALNGWEWSEGAPSVTAGLVGGPNEGSSREFRRVSDTARENEWGDVIETFVDARSETTTSAILAAGQQAIASGGPTSGFKVDLQETAAFHYGAGGVHVGDLVQAEVAGQVRTDVLREATLSWDRDNGFKATPIVGEHSDDPDKQLNRYIQILARGYRALKTR